MHPSSLLSFYPTYQVLDEIISVNKNKKINIFMDLKNNLQTTYMQHAIVNIVESTKKSKFIDTSVFSSLIAFLSFHKIYAIKRGLDINFIIFFETGHSFYHKNISKSYKISRKIDDLYGLDAADRDIFFKTLQNNFQLIEKACNRMPNLKVVRMQNFEADFIPYYLITRKIVNSEESTNIIYSNDHDMYQCVNKNTFIFSKSGKNKKIIKSGNILSTYLKKECSIPDEYYPLCMSILGDPGDDVKGIDKIGPSRLIEIFNQIPPIFGTMEHIYERILNRKPIIDIIPDRIQNKYLKSIVDEEINNKKITDNMRLVSFEIISRELDDPKTTEIIEKRKHIEKLFTEKVEIPPAESMKKALEMNGVFLEESSIDFLYV